MSQDWINRLADHAAVCDRRAAEAEAEARGAQAQFAGMAGGENQVNKYQRSAEAWKARAAAARKGQLLHDPGDVHWSYEFDGLIAEATAAGHVVYPEGFGRDFNGV